MGLAKVLRTAEGDVAWDVPLVELWLPVPTVGGLHSSVEMWLIGLSQIYRLRVWQCVVFILKLILSYLPVYLTNSLLSSLQVGCLGFGTEP